VTVSIVTITNSQGRVKSPKFGTNDTTEKMRLGRMWRTGFGRKRGTRKRGERVTRIVVLGWSGRGVGEFKQKIE